MSVPRDIALVLAGAWRDTDSPLAQSAAQLETITPSLLQSGAAALAYWRVRRSPLKDSDAAQRLRQEYRTQAERTVMRLHDAQNVLSALQKDGIEPLVFKGWAIARHYPDLALRPFTDIDLFVRPADYERAERIALKIHGHQIGVDLHTRTADQTHATRSAARTLDELFQRSEWVIMSETPVRVLSPEDHLQLIALHCLRHGAWQPLWLCDLAVALETRPASFDWARCLGGPPNDDYVACALGLAHQLLGARVDDTPVAARAANLPRWLVPAVLAQWQDPDPTHRFPPEPIRRVWHDPRRLARALRGRWIDPVQATTLTAGRFDGMPAVLHQARYFINTGARFVGRRIQ